MSLFLTTVFVFGFVMFIMAIGVMLGRQQIQGGCGGEEGCELCFFKYGKFCEGKSSCEVDTVLPGECESSGGESSCLIEDSLSDTGK